MLKKLYHKLWQDVGEVIEYSVAFMKGDMNATLNIVYGEDEKNNSFDVFYSNNHKGKMPTIIVFHGGGYVSGVKENISSFCKLLAQKGFLVFNVEYTKCDTEEGKYFPAQVYEFFDFYKHVTEDENLVKLIDFDNIFLAGNSAGAHIAALIANIQTNPELKIEYGVQGGPKIKGVILLSPSFGAYKFAGMFPKRLFHEVIFGEEEVRDPMFEYTHNLEITTECFPPTIMFSVKRDLVVGVHKRKFLKLAEELNLSLKHYEYQSGYKLFHSSMATYPDKYPSCIDKIEDFVNDAKEDKFVSGVVNEKLYESTDLILRDLDDKDTTITEINAEDIQEQVQENSL